MKFCLHIDRSFYNGSVGGREYDDVSLTAETFDEAIEEAKTRLPRILRDRCIEPHRVLSIHVGLKVRFNYNWEEKRIEFPSSPAQA